MSKEKTALTIRLDSIHWEIIEGLTPFYGSSRSEVIRNIVTMWLHSNLGSETMATLKANNAIKLQLGIKTKPEK